jgi:branched-chain amino acid transport system substrate-binding protein
LRTLAPTLADVARLRTSISLACAASIVIAACSDGGDATPEPTFSTTTTTTVPERTDDGVLTLGILLPTSNAAIGEPTIAAAEEAVARINDAGGVFGEEVERYVADEGSTTASAADGIQALVDRHVDAIIGPSSSTIALSALGQIVSDGVVTCSPTASSLALDTPLDDNLIFRTIPSDSLQARAIAETIEQTGLPTAAIAFVDDAYGRPFAEAVEDALSERGIAWAGSIPFTGRDDDVTAAAEDLVGTGAPALVVLAAAEEGTSMLSALGQVDHSGVSIVVVNDAIRTPSPPQLVADLDDSLREKIRGVAPQADSDDPDEPWDPPGFFAVNAYNCVNLIALAAMQAGSDSPRQIAGQMAAVSDNGAPCMSFRECAEVYRGGRTFDYEGPVGEIELLAGQGDPSVGRFQQFSFDDTGRDVVDGSIVVRY